MDAPAPGPSPGPAPTPAPGEDLEAKAKEAWTKARETLLSKRYEEAKSGYAALAKTYGSTAVVSSNLERVRAGRKAADVGLRGAAALLKAPATSKDGRLVVEYEFEEDGSVPGDFTVEQAFAGQAPKESEVRSGMAILSGSTAILLNVVFEPGDVQWEADCVADENKDFGLYALQEGKELKVLALHVGNTQFALGRGAAAKVLEGTIVWLFGDGVWRDAEAGQRGFVRLAQQRSGSWKAGERLPLALDVRGDKFEAEVKTKNDAMRLQGNVKGDDGKGIGPIRVGCFAHRGRVGIERLKVNGRVDAKWLSGVLDSLIAQESGPN